MALLANSKWMKLALDESDLDRHFVSINANEFLNISVNYLSSTILFKTYDVRRDEVSKAKQLKKSEVKRTARRWSFDKGINRLVLRTSWPSNASVDIIDLQTMQTEVVNNVKEGHHFMCINGFIHVFNQQNDHFIAFIKNKRLNPLIDTLTDHRYNGNTIGQGAIYVSSQKRIVLIGNNGTWIYSLKSNKWMEIKNLSFNFHFFESVLSSNQRYIILFGGWKDGKKSDVIFVLDMKIKNQWKIKKSKILIPMIVKQSINWTRLLRTGGDDSKDEVLVIGFIRSVLQGKNLRISNCRQLTL